MATLTKRIDIGKVHLGGGGGRPLIIAGPCVIEGREVTRETAEGLKEICQNAGFQLVFKSSYDKANRTSIGSFRGQGMKEGLKILADIKSDFGLPIISDIHSTQEVDMVKDILDVIQVPALLSRQTDLIIAAANSGKPVNVKKGQFSAPWDMRNVIKKAASAGCEDLILTERGSSFGYNNLVVDFRSLPLMRAYGYPVVFDVTHSLQLPGAGGTASGGQREFATQFARAAVAVGVDGLFFEVHPDPDNALCDGPNMVSLDDFQALLESVGRIADA